MNKEEFEKYYPNLMKWYKEGDCCNDIVELRKENKQLKSQLQQKENIIKEVREQINKDRGKQYSDLEKKAFYCNKTNKLLEILDKENNET